MNGLKLIARAHQLVMEGYKFMFDEKNIVTVWSCPNYCYNSGNVASVMLVDEVLRYDFRIFTEVKEPPLKGYRLVRAGCGCCRMNMRVTAAGG